MHSNNTFQNRNPHTTIFVLFFAREPATRRTSSRGALDLGGALLLPILYFHSRQPLSACNVVAASEMT